MQVIYLPCSFVIDSHSAIAERVAKASAEHRTDVGDNLSFGHFSKNFILSKHSNIKILRSNNQFILSIITEV